MKIIAFIGPTGTGKSSIQKGVQEYYRDRASYTNDSMNDYLRVKTVVTTTDRAIRHGEKNGKDYHFVIPETFKTGVVNDHFIEVKTVKDYEEKEIHYGLKKDALGILSNNNDILLLSLDIGGLINLQQYLQEQELDSNEILFPIFIETSAERRMRRCMIRATGDTGQGPHIKCPDETVYKICERMIHDAEENEEAKDYCILTIKNEMDCDKQECVSFVIKLIQGML